MLFMWPSIPLNNNQEFIHNMTVVKGECWDERFVPLSGQGLCSYGQ